MSKSATYVYRAGHGVVTREEASAIDAVAGHSKRGAAIQIRTNIRGRWVFRNGQLVDAYTAGPHPGEMRRNSNVISDCQPFKSTIDGRMISSKRQWRDELRAHGCIEVGNEYVKPTPTPRRPVGEDIKTAMELIEAGKGVSEDSLPNISSPLCN